MRNAYFKEKFVEELKSKIPEKIQELDIVWGKKTQGIIRFDDDKLDVVYLYACINNVDKLPLKHENYENYDVIFKFTNKVFEKMYYANAGVMRSEFQIGFDGELNITAIYMSGSITPHFAQQIPVIPHVIKIIAEKFSISEKSAKHALSIFNFWRDFEQKPDNKISVVSWQIERNGKQVESAYVITKKEPFEFDLKEVQKIVTGYKEKEAIGFYKGEFDGKTIKENKKVLYLDVGRDASKLPSMSTIAFGEYEEYESMMNYKTNTNYDR